MHISIQWPNVPSPAACYYATDAKGMIKDYSAAAGALPDGTWAFLAPTQTTAGGTRGIYNQIVLAPNQFKPGVGMQPLNADCEIHVDYDVDQGDPQLAMSVADLGLSPNGGAVSGSATLSPPSIGLDDSVYVGTENGIFYSFSYES